nr:protelomerase family protein [Petrachloros mirabilis]
MVAGFITQLQQADSEAAIQALCAAEIDLLEEGYPRLTLASDYIPRYRQALEAAIEAGTLPLTPQTSHRYVHHQRVTGKSEERFEHLALTYLKYSAEEYEALDTRQAQVNRTRQLNLKTVPVDQYLEVLQSLLKARGKFAARHLAIAIAGVTGRRIGEVVARGSFRLTEHPYMLHFSGQQKHERDSYDIVTLLPAQEVLTALNRFRRMSEVKALRGSKGGLGPSQQGEALRRGINKFDVQVNRECEKLLRQPGIVPVLAGKKSVSVHNLRSLWGAIATYFFCPEHHHEYAFLQHYLGHVMQSSATGNYFRFQLVDTEGKLIRDKGVLLPEVGELPLLAEAVLPETPELGSIPTQSPGAQSAQRQKLPATPSAASLATLEAEVQRQMDEKLAQERQAMTTQLETLQAEVQAQLESLRQQVDLRWLVQRVESLEAENEALRQAKETAHQSQQGDSQTLKELRSQNQTLATQLHDAQQTLDHFRQLLLGSSPPDAGQPTPETPAPPVPPPVPSAPQVSVVHQPSRIKGRAMQRAEKIFYAIQEWNHLHPEQTFAVNPGLLESIFRIHRKAAKEFCATFQNELWEHHSDIGVENLAGHNRGKDAQALKAFVDERT